MKYLALALFCAPAFASLTTTASLRVSYPGSSCGIDAAGTASAVARIADIEGECSTELNRAAIGSAAAAYGELGLSTGQWWLGDVGTFSGYAAFADFLTFESDGVVQFSFSAEYSFLMAKQASARIQSSGFTDNHAPVAVSPWAKVFEGSAAYLTSPVQVSAGVPVPLSESLELAMYVLQGTITGSALLRLAAIEFVSTEGPMAFTAASGTEYASYAILAPSAELPTAHQPEPSTAGLVVLAAGLLLILRSVIRPAM